jgi:hypothetical protein
MFNKIKSAENGELLSATSFTSSALYTMAESILFLLYGTWVCSVYVSETRTTKLNFKLIRNKI